MQSSQGIIARALNAKRKVHGLMFIRRDINRRCRSAADIGIEIRTGEYERITDDLVFSVDYSILGINKFKNDIESKGFIEFELQGDISVLFKAVDRSGAQNLFAGSIALYVHLSVPFKFIHTIILHHGTKKSQCRGVILSIGADHPPDF